VTVGQKALSNVRGSEPSRERGRAHPGEERHHAVAALLALGSFRRLCRGAFGDRSVLACRRALGLYTAVFPIVPRHSFRDLFRGELAVIL